MNEPLRGVWTALVTPFRDGRLDQEALEALVEAQVAAGIAGLVPCGTTGESPTLSADEFERVLAVVRDVAGGRVPIFAGVGTNSTEVSRARARVARRLGVDGVMVVCPYYNKPTQPGLEAHFLQVARAAELPVMIYDIPGRTGVQLRHETMLRLFEEEPAFVAVKEASGDLDRMQRLAAALEGRGTLLVGDDALTLAALAVGATGVVSVASNVVPEAVAEVVGRWEEADFPGALEAHRRLLPLHEALFLETNPAPVKAALALQGRLVEELRLPLAPVTESTREHLRGVLRELAAFHRGVRS